MKIIDVEGIGPVYREKLVAAGIRTTTGLLKAAANRKGRVELAEKTGISDKLILEWVNHADLMRVKGVGSEFSDLLEAAGVDTVKELRNRNPQNLHEAIVKTNAEKELVRRVPSLTEVQSWIEHAKLLDPLITY
jgi:predicted flap endonuclease-1-like 5' DNA nuclease